jgi:acyl-CoA synthetase (AMP-forming)/AMP-acid ligase II
MPPPRPDRRSLWDFTATGGFSTRRFVADSAGTVPLVGFPRGSSLGAPLEKFRGKTVFLSCERQLPAVLALVELDGICRRLLLCPPDLAPAHLPEIFAEAGVDFLVTDGTGPAAEFFPPDVERIELRENLAPIPDAPEADRDAPTEWLLFTSGTTGRPKLVVHTLDSLTGPLDDGLAVAPDAIWSTFYDVRRYGGLQILLRGLLGGGSMVLSQAREPVADFLARVGQSGVTHMSGTPSHWRRALMSAAPTKMAPRYVRLSGEVADQAILDHLAAAFPGASVAHAFASTEAGVAFDVRDGRSGFPASLIGQIGAKTEMRVVDGSLRIRSARTAARYLSGGAALADADGFVDTGDMLELRDGRYYFVGRREGVINVGGQKVFPEEVEAVINQHPGVRFSRVRGRRSPITGALVVAEFVRDPAFDSMSFAALKDEILGICQERLAAHKVPAMLREVAALDIAESGKLARPRA